MSVTVAVPDNKELLLYHNVFERRQPISRLYEALATTVVNWMHQKSANTSALTTEKQILQKKASSFCWKREEACIGTTTSTNAEENLQVFSWYTIQSVRVIHKHVFSGFYGICMLFCSQWAGCWPC
jgi:hypothetical protein